MRFSGQDDPMGGSHFDSGDGLMPSRFKAGLNAFGQSPLTVGLVVGVAFGAFAWWRWSANQRDITRNIMAARTIVNPDEVPADIYVDETPGSLGYDGQYVYRLALEPLSRKRTDYGIRLDSPAYRQQRILLPTLAWLFSFGKPQNTALALLLINGIFLCVIGFVAALYARALQMSVWWGVPIALYPGFLISLSRDLTEIVEAAFLLSGLLLLRSRQPIWATAAFCLAVLGRDTAILTVGAIGIAWLAEQAIQRRWMPSKLTAWLRAGSVPHPPLPSYVFAVPLGMYVSWLLYLRSVWGLFPFQEYGQSANTLEPAFQAFVSFVRQLFDQLQHNVATPLETVWFTQCLLLTGVCGTALVLWRQTSANLVERLTFLLYLALASFYGGTIWQEDYGFLRILTELYALAFIVLIGARSPAKIVLGTLGLYVFGITVASYTYR